MIPAGPGAPAGTEPGAPPRTGPGFRARSVTAAAAALSAAGLLVPASPGGAAASTPRGAPGPAAGWTVPAAPGHGPAAPRRHTGRDTLAGRGTLTGRDTLAARSTLAARDTLTALDAPAEPGWTFPVGEEAVYRVDVALGPVGTPRPVGEARLRVEARDTVDGRPAYRTSLELEARIPLIYRMDNRQVSWIVPDPFRTLRYEERLREGDHRRHRRYRLDQEEGTYTRFDRDDGGWRAVEGWTGVPMPPRALDEVAFLYLVRALPLEPGRTYRLTRHFEEDGNPVILEVLRRETVRVPAGRFETVVVRPVIRTSGLFSRGGRAEVFVTDDRRRLVVEIRSRMKVGRVHFRLESYSPGATPPTATTGRTTGAGAETE